jgi:4-amino-4-deoxy-L-arabinose transferase-like glycosyltransferase
MDLKVSEYIEQNKLFLVVTSLLFFSFLYRIPFWFIDVIDWDESTFILLGKSILERNVPYIEYWDLKPPVAFLSVSAIMALLGESILSMRVLGAFSVFLSSILVYFIVRKFFNSSLSKPYPTDTSLACSSFMTSQSLGSVNLVGGAIIINSI